MIISLNKGPQYRPQYAIVHILGTCIKSTLMNFGKAQNNKGCWPALCYLGVRRAQGYYLLRPPDYAKIKMPEPRIRPKRKLRKASDIPADPAEKKRIKLAWRFLWMRGPSVPSMS